MFCRLCNVKLTVPTMLLVGDSDAFFRDEMWQHLDLHVHNCWVPSMLYKCSHWCPQDWCVPHRTGHALTQMHVSTERSAASRMHTSRMPSSCFSSSSSPCSWCCGSARHRTCCQLFGKQLCASCSPEAVNELIRAFLNRAVEGFQADPGAPGYPPSRREE